MGLIITHHYAEPLGAEMFAQAYPDLEPMYSKYPEKFRALWQTDRTFAKFRIFHNLKPRRSSAPVPR